MSYQQFMPDATAVLSSPPDPRNKWVVAHEQLKSLGREGHLPLRAAQGRHGAA